MSTRNNQMTIERRRSPRVPFRVPVTVARVRDPAPAGATYPRPGCSHADCREDWVNWGRQVCIDEVH